MSRTHYVHHHHHWLIYILLPLLLLIFGLQVGLIVTSHRESSAKPFIPTITPTPQLNSN